MLALIQSARETWGGGKSSQSQSDSGNAGGTGGTGGFGNITGLGELQSLMGNQYNLESFMRGDFQGIQFKSPEEKQAAREVAQQLTEQVKIQTSINASNTRSFRASKDIFANEQYHIRERLKLALDMRASWVETKAMIEEILKPGIAQQDQNLSISQANGQRKLSKIQARTAERQQKLAMLR